MQEDEKKADMVELPHELKDARTRKENGPKWAEQRSA